MSSSDFSATRNQTRAVRAACASALHNVNPKRFATVAKRIIGDASEYDDLRATVLSTLTIFPTMPPSAAT